MNRNEIEALHEARPFHPFTIRIGDTRELPVPHPEFLALSPSEDIAIVFRPDGGFNIVDIELVTDLELKPGLPDKRRPPSRRRT